ncbi:MAG TPA: hypothetical protein VJ955_02020 [Desulfuromonadales bacterium]|nr:hypothetical protein [Desulfuromonadales bacterium]
MKRNLGRLAVLVAWGTAIGLTVLDYNLWFYSCQGCSSIALSETDIPEYGFLGLTVVAALILVFLKWRRKVALDRRRCDCDALLDPNWGYCPVCGSFRQKTSA